MTRARKRIKVAEVCGWIFKPDEFDWSFAKRHKGDPWWKYREGEEPFPDYAKSLDAMHEAEEHLTDEQWKEYAQLLLQPVVRHGAVNYYEAQKQHIHASAAQRFEAFGIALKLWKPGE